MNLYRHVKSGRVYALLSQTVDEADAETGRVTYQGVDEDRIWDRVASEFFDGRFQKLRPSDLSLPGAWHGMGDCPYGDTLVDLRAGNMIITSTRWTLCDRDGTVGGVMAWSMTPKDFHPTHWRLAYDPLAAEIFVPTPEQIAWAMNVIGPVKVFTLEDQKDPPDGDLTLEAAVSVETLAALVRTVISAAQSPGPLSSIAAASPAFQAACASKQQLFGRGGTEEPR